MATSRLADDCVELKRASGASCQIALFGAHVKSWRPDGRERLFVSSTTKPPPTALRGGVPICWPQFAARGSGPKHGFARTSAKWKVLSTATEPSPTVTFELCDDEETRAVWPSKFRVLYHVTLPADAELTMAMQVMNKGEEALEFTTALHTYFAVSSVGKVAIDGLSGLTYEDSVAPRGADGQTARVVESAEQLKIEGEVDRVYLASPDKLTLTDGTDSLQILAQGFKVRRLRARAPLLPTQLKRQRAHPRPHWPRSGRGRVEHWRGEGLGPQRFGPGRVGALRVHRECCHRQGRQARPPRLLDGRRVVHCVLTAEHCILSNCTTVVPAQRDPPHGCHGHLASRMDLLYPDSRGLHSGGCKEATTLAPSPARRRSRPETHPDVNPGTVTGGDSGLSLS